ncbi:MAG: F0F1 ATP synthase subunit epsilon [Candidatus Omnitrophica bacterium]|nr:F0F1 ATP synthase subunit epsilon [Candidatus Omnitrophota bacterium]
MARTFELNIISPEKTLYKGKISSLIVPSEVGYLGILCDHTPLVANLGKGKITIKDPEEKVVTLDSPGRGFLEVLQKKVTILFN